MKEQLGTAEVEVVQLTQQAPVKEEAVEVEQPETKIEDQ